MQVLLNVTADELEFVGGDQRYYHTLEQAGRSTALFTAFPLQHTSPVLRKRVRLSESLGHKVPVPSLTRRLYLEGRRLPVSRRDLDTLRPDLVFSTILAARLPRGSKTANVFYSQGINAPGYYEYTHGPTVDELAGYYRALSRSVTLMIVGTHDGLRRLNERCPDLACPAVHAPQVVLTEPSVSCAHKEADEPVRFLFVGRDYVRKGLPEVLAAYRRVAPLARLDIITVANCPLQPGTADLANVHWHSNVSDADLEALYHAAHVLVVPTHADTYNLVLVEAMAHGCAIITSDLPPMDEIAPPGVVGDIVPRGDSQALGDVMEQVVQDRARLKRYMTGALNHYREQHAPEKTIPQLLAAFEQAIELAR